MYFFQPLTPAIATDMGWSLAQANALNASLSPPSERGRTFGTLIAGGMLAVTLSRPWATTLASSGTWKTVFFVSAACMSLAFWAVMAVFAHYGWPAASIVVLTLTAAAAVTQRHGSRAPHSTK